MGGLSGGIGFCPLYGTIEITKMPRLVENLTCMLPTVRSDNARHI